MTVEPTFKRAKRIVALHYGSNTFSTRKLCKLFRAHRPDADKNELIIQEAARILELRRKLGYDASSDGIDATTIQEVEAKRAERNGKPLPDRSLCLACKKQIQLNGWQVGRGLIQACAGECTAVASFYYHIDGARKSPCKAFANYYGTDVRDLSPAVSLYAMLAYIAQLTAHRKKREQRNAELGNPTVSSV